MFGDFKLDDVPRVLGFLAASTVGAAVGATGAALAKGLAELIALAQVWPLWFAARLMGTLTVAPVLIGLGEAVRERPPRRELIEGTLGFGTLAGLGVYIISLPGHPWESALPLAPVVPVLLWITVRCRPVFTAAAVSLMALTFLWGTASDIRHLGDTNSPPADRVVAGQIYVLTVSLLALVLAALFAERRSREALLSIGNERLRTQEETFCRLLGSLPAAIYTTDKAGRITYCNQAAVALWGMNPRLGEHRWSDLWRLHHPDGTSVPLDERPTQIVLNEGRAVRGREALLERPDGTLVPIMPCPAPLIDEQGTIIGVVNMQLDLTEQKRAEAARRQLRPRLRDGGRAVDVSAVASRTQDSGVPPVEFVATLAGPIQSMAATHELLSDRQWKGIMAAWFPCDGGERRTQIPAFASNGREPAVPPSMPQKGPAMVRRPFAISFPTSWAERLTLCLLPRVSSVS